MNYKIPFGGCSCGCGTSGNNAGGATTSAQTYKLLSCEDPVVSLKENTIAELDFSKMSAISGIDLEMASDQVSAGFQTVEGRNIYVPKLKEETEYPFGVCFGAFPYKSDEAYSIATDYPPNANWNFGGLSNESFLMEMGSNGFTAINYWIELLNFYQEFYDDSFNADTGNYGFLYARTADGNFTDYRVCEYINEFPDMMSLDEILWYLTNLKQAGFFKTYQRIYVPLTDRIHIETSDFVDGSYLYYAEFENWIDGQIHYRRIVGAYTSGNSVNSLINSSTTNINGQTIYPAFVFCQKRKDTLGVYKIPLDIPSDFNNGGKTTIMLRNTPNGYLELQAVGKTFMPLQGDDLVWENLKDSYVLPILYHREGTIELETIKRGEEDTILVSEHLCFVNQLSGSSSDSSDGSTSSDEDDILDYSDVAAIYSSM